MENILALVATAVPVVAVIILVALVVIFGYVKAPPDIAYIISGVRKEPRILVGKAGIKIPFFERLDKLSLGAIQIDVKTGSSVPTAEYINVRIDSTVSVRVSQDPSLMKIAAQNFLNVSREEIARKVNDLLEGNIREIAGSMKLTEMVSDRKKFSEQVQENAVPDLQRFGLELVSFNVQNFVDDNDVITNLGIDNVEQIRKAAMIAKSNAQREVAIAEAENAKISNDAKVKAAEEIAVRNNDLAIKKAQLQKVSDTEQAQADAALKIEAENQRKIQEVAAANADIARTERETELKRQQIELKERELDALVRKQADAEKYAAEKKAEAELITRKKKAEAERYTREQEAEAMKAQADAAKYAAMAEAEGIAAKGAAEAEAILKKAEAQKQMGEASVIDMILQTLPKMTEAAAAPLSNIDNLTMYGEGNGSKMVGDVMKITNQVMEGLSANGINVVDILNRAMNQNK